MSHSGSESLRCPRAGKRSAPGLFSSRRNTALCKACAPLWTGIEEASEVVCKDLLNRVVSDEGVPYAPRLGVGGIGGDVQVQPELSNRGSSRPCTSEGRLPRSERDSGNPGRRIAWVRCSRESPHRPAANRSFSKVKFPFLAAPNIRITGRIRLRRIRNLLICIYVHIYRKIKNKARESSYSSWK